MRIVRPICCGADIHKDIIVATIATTNQDGITEYSQMKFCTQYYDLLRLKSWLIQHNCFEIAMESTGKYWIPIFNVLEDDIKTYIVHPKYTKAIKAKKPTRRIQNGLQIFLNMIFSSFPLFRLEKFANYVNCLDTESN